MGGHKKQLLWMHIPSTASAKESEVDGQIKIKVATIDSTAAPQWIE